MYDSIRITGEQTNGYITAVKGSKTLVQEAYDAAAHNFVSGLDKPTWEMNTVMLATYSDFSTLLSASNYSVSSLVSGYKVFREENGVLYYITDTSANTKAVYDFAAKANTKQLFYVYPKVGSGDSMTLSEPIISEEVMPQWDGWSVIGLVKRGKNTYEPDMGNIWNLALNIDSGEIRNTNNRQQHDTYARFPKVMYGRRRYQEGSIKCLLGKMDGANCEYVDSPALMDEWEEFVNNGQMKLLKTTKGVVYPVDIYNSSFDIMDEYIGEPVELSFDWVQIADIKNLSVSKVVSA